MKVAVVGAGGHIGLPLALVLADRGHHVFGLDINKASNARIMAGEMPFLEEGGEDFLKRALAAKRLEMTDDQTVIAKADVVIVIIGTPVDENFNPRLDGLLRFLEAVKKHLKNQLLILRSTVSPGTTERVKNMLGAGVAGTPLADLDLVFTPERVLQGKSIHEIRHLPQLVGAFDDRGYERAATFFRSFVDGDLIRLKPIEAELGKLITNMTRYIEFAIANEFHLICETFGASALRVIDACNKNYPRLKLPVPGPNVGGPCLYKDGWFLVERIPYNELIVTSFRIHEGMPIHIVEKLAALKTVKRVAILGMTFKADNDDIRNSLSYKIVRQLEFRGFEVVKVEPHLPDFDPIEKIQGVDAVILMTPHKQFGDLDALVKQVGNPECTFVDLWGFWKSMRHKSENGYFQAKEVKA